MAAVLLKRRKTHGTVRLEGDYACMPPSGQRLPSFSIACPLRPISDPSDRVITMTFLNCVPMAGSPCRPRRASILAWPRATGSRWTSAKVRLFCVGCRAPGWPVAPLLHRSQVVLRYPLPSRVLAGRASSPLRALCSAPSGHFFKSPACFYPGSARSSAQSCWPGPWHRESAGRP